jgi:hypothetical protein
MKMSYNSNEICKKTNEMEPFFINNLIQLYSLVHVSNNQGFIFRNTCTCSFMVLYRAEITIKVVSIAKVQEV